MRTQVFALVVVAASAVSTGCTSLNSFQRSEYEAMKVQGVAIEEKKPKVAAVLGVLPGGGSFYTRQWGMGVVDLLLWPWSIIWDPFVGYSGAEAVNYDVSRGYLKRRKADELAELERKLEDNKVTQAEYVELRRSVESRYDFD
jgi:hypothetical protein